MELKRVSDIDLAWTVFRQGQLTDDENRSNYTRDQFDFAWPLWTNFYYLKSKDDIVCFCGARKFKNNLLRIFDRYYVFPDYRSNTLRHSEHSILLVSQMIDDALSLNMQPFISIQELRKRRSLEMAVYRFNKYLNKDTKLKVLDGLYCTVPELKNKSTSWQNVATVYPYKISLERKYEQ